jgi:hypothetical protein
MQNSRKESTPVRYSRLENSNRLPSESLGAPIEIIPSKYIFLYIKPSLLDKLYWLSDTKPPQNYSSAYFFCIDNVCIHSLFLIWLGSIYLNNSIGFGLYAL